jgi:hypothetical protein
VQVPARQLSDPAQAFPHVPQLAGFTFRSTQDAPHCVSPEAWQEMTQSPAAHA